MAKIKTILISTLLLVSSSLWSASALEDSLSPSDSVIPTRRLSELPIENLEKKRAIAHNLRSFFVPFNETARTLMVLNNLCEAMKEGVGFTVQIWEDYLKTQKILAADQLSLFRPIYGNVLKALRETSPAYFDPRHHFRSGCFLSLLFGELGEPTFPTSYLKPLVFWEWRSYQYNRVPAFVHTFVDLLNRITQKMDFAMSPTEKDCENWHALSIDRLLARKTGLDFSDFLRELKDLRLQSIALGLTQTTVLCTDFRNSLEAFHKAGLPLIRELERIMGIKGKRENPSPSQVAPHLLPWSLTGDVFANYILLKGERKDQPPLILECLGTTLLADAEITPTFRIRNQSVICDESMKCEISESSIGAFLRQVWPTLKLFFRQGDLVPFSVYEAQYHSEHQRSLDELEGQMKALKQRTKDEKTALEQTHKERVAKLTRSTLLAEEEQKRLGTVVKDLKAKIKSLTQEIQTQEKLLEESKKLQQKLEEAVKKETAAKEDLEKRLQEATRQAQATKAPPAPDRTPQLEQEISSLRQEKERIQQELHAAQTEFTKEKETFERRLQEAMDAHRKLQLLLEAQEKERQKPPTPSKIREKEDPVSPSSCTTTSAAGNDGSPPSVKKPAALPPSTTKFSVNAPAFVPSSSPHPPPVRLPPITPIPAGMQWVMGPYGWILVPVSSYPYFS